MGIGAAITQDEPADKFTSNMSIFCVSFFPFFIALPNKE